MRTVVALLLVAAAAAAQEYELQLDPRVVVTPLPEVRPTEPEVLTVPEPPVDLPLPDLDLSEVLGIDRASEQAARIQAGAAGAVWRPLEVGVTVRPVAEIRDEAGEGMPGPEGTPRAGGARFEPVLAYARQEDDDAGGGRGIGLVTEEGLVPEGFQGFTMPPLSRDTPTVTFRIERVERDPWSELMQRPRRPRR